MRCSEPVGASRFQSLRPARRVAELQSLYRPRIFMIFPNVVSRSLIGALLLLSICGNSFGRCAPSRAYQASFEILSCEDKDPKDHSKVIGFGAILDLNVFSKRIIESSTGYDWWSLNDPLPEKMEVFYDKRNATCASIKLGVKKSGTFRYLCCDGAEPRCNYGTSVALYDLKK
jgi:hypothetical protein